jgi:hypothetical protein
LKNTNYSPEKNAKFFILSPNGIFFFPFLKNLFHDLVNIAASLAEVSVVCAMSVVRDLTGTGARPASCAFSEGALLEMVRCRATAVVASGE